MYSYHDKTIIDLYFAYCVYEYSHLVAPDPLDTVW